MCIAVPARIESLDGQQGVVDVGGGVLLPVNLSLIEEPAVGDYIIVHAGFGIQKMDKARAQEALEMLKALTDMDDDPDSVPSLQEN
ncbi:MAG: HypC/HybG/HupF family hydrogenase formation chaperone [Desulfatibacillaceae bacterium]|nr:HypC/HybG/HupF family hydrogenase formation chaperone [Desulfatibacillaceae bacterium]